MKKKITVFCTTVMLINSYVALGQTESESPYAYDYSSNISAQPYQDNRADEWHHNNKGNPPLSPAPSAYSQPPINVYLNATQAYQARHPNERHGDTRREQGRDIRHVYQQRWERENQAPLPDDQREHYDNYSFEREGAHW